MNEETFLHDLEGRIIHYYCEEDATQIAHTQCVAHYTRWIAQGEGCSPRHTFLLEVAAWLHDIGCPSARASYGSSKPVYQQREGARIAAQWLAEYDALNPEEQSWVAQAVGSHHQCRQACQLHFEPLFEADVIVNLFEGYYKRERAQIYYDHMLWTKTGKELFQEFFL